MSKVDIPEGIIAILAGQIEKTNTMIADLQALVELQGEVIQKTFGLVSQGLQTGNQNLQQKTYDMLRAHVARGAEADARLPFLEQAPAVPSKPKRTVINREALYVTAAGIIQHSGGAVKVKDLLAQMPSVLVKDMHLFRFSTLLSTSGRFTKTKAGWTNSPRTKKVGTRGGPKKKVDSGWDFVSAGAGRINGLASS